jgi:nucleoside phosphorylase
VIAIVVAFGDEVKDYLRRERFRVVESRHPLRSYRSPSRPNVVVVEGGAGRLRAEDATSQAIERYGPDAIVSAGFAGGAKPGLKSGDLFICNRLVSVEGPAESWSLDAASDRVVEKADLLVEGSRTYDFCECLTVPQLVSKSSVKAWIGPAFDVSLIDMESYWVSVTASAYSVPHLVVRSVLDPVDETLPAFVEEAVSAEGGSSLWRAFRHVVTRPGEIPRLARLAAQARAARASLCGFLESLTSEMDEGRKTEEEIQDARDKHSPFVFRPSSR